MTIDIAKGRLNEPEEESSGASREFQQCDGPPPLFQSGSALSGAGAR